MTIILIVKISLIKKLVFCLNIEHYEPNLDLICQNFENVGPNIDHVNQNIKRFNKHFRDFDQKFQLLAKMRFEQNVGDFHKNIYILNNPNVLTIFIQNRPKS